MIKKLAIAAALILGQAAVAGACPAGLRAFNKQLEGRDTCVLEKTYVGDLELTSGYNYILYGAVWIGSEKRDKTTTNLEEPIQAGKLTINPGVKIFALNPVDDQTGLWDGFVNADGDLVTSLQSRDIKTFLSVTRDSQIIVKGTESAPVIMTSAQGAHQVVPAFQKLPGDWGGLVINGKAKSNKCKQFAGCTLPGEADTGWYGGEDDEHNSGILQYLQVEYGGDQIDDEKQLNGVTFNTVGLGTVIDNVAVLHNADDCIEFFGGAATGRNIFCYKGQDDGIDTTDGARIFLQNGVVVAEKFSLNTANDRHMLEADSSKNDDNNKKLRSHPVLVNFTFVGVDKNSQGFKIRRGTDYTLVNSVMYGAKTFCLDPSGANQINFSSNAFADCPAADPIMTVGDDVFMAANDLMIKDWAPAGNSPLLEGAEYMEEFFPADALLDEAFADVYEEVDYRGAIGDEDWTSWIQIRN